MAGTRTGWEVRSDRSHCIIASSEIGCSYSKQTYLYSSWSERRVWVSTPPSDGEGKLAQPLLPAPQLTVPDALVSTVGGGVCVWKTGLFDRFGIFCPANGSATRRDEEAGGGQAGVSPVRSCSGAGGPNSIPSEPN